MKPCPCGAIPTTSSDITYSVVWCPSCHKTLTPQYATVEDAILAWNHGPEVLPPWCPFCKWPPHIIGPDTETPQVTCEMPCPIRGRVFTLEEWNRTRPKTYLLDEMVGRWEKRRDPKLRNVLKAVRKAVTVHVRQRFRGDL